MAVRLRRLMYEYTDYCETVVFTSWVLHVCGLFVFWVTCDIFCLTLNICEALFWYSVWHWVWVQYVLHLCGIIMTRWASFDSVWHYKSFILWCPIYCGQSDEDWSMPGHLQRIQSEKTARCHPVWLGTGTLPDMWRLDRPQGLPRKRWLAGAKKYHWMVL